jgi:hypothetical protein
MIKARAARANAKVGTKSLSILIIMAASALPGLCRVVEIQQQRLLAPNIPRALEERPQGFLDAGYFRGHPASRV